MGSRHFVHADAGIADCYQNVLAGRRTPMLRHKDVIEVDIGRFDGQLSTIRHGITRVHGQVHEHLFDLPRIGVDAAERGQVERQRDVLAEDTAKQQLHAPQHVIHVEDLRLEDLAAAEREELARQAAAALAAAA